MKSFKIKKQKSILSGFTLLMLLVGSLLLSCKQDAGSSQDDVTAADVKEEISEAVDTSQAYLQEEKKEIYNEYEEQISKAENRIDVLERKIESGSNEVKNTYIQVVDSLQAKKSQVSDDIDRLKNSSDAAWAEVKAGVDEALSDLDQAIDDAESEFQNKSS